MGWCHGPIEAPFAASKENFFNKQAENFAKDPKYRNYWCDGQIEIEGLYVHENRNKIRDRFMEMDADYLWMVDSDVILEEDSLDQLMKHATPDRVIAGKYRSNWGGVFAPVWMSYDRKKKLYDLHPIWDQDTEPFYISACGMGNTLIPRKILEALPKYPFDFRRRGGVLIGEDVAFCQRVLEKGFGILAVPQARVLHVKRVAL